MTYGRTEKLPEGAQTHSNGKKSFSSKIVSQTGRCKMLDITLGKNGCKPNTPGKATIHRLASIHERKSAKYLCLLILVEVHDLELLGDIGNTRAYFEAVW